MLHPTSLPGPYGSGDLGPGARRFIDFLAAARQRWWQMLPVGPCGFGNSPYSALSAFAGNPMLISLDALVEDGLLSRGELESSPLLEGAPQRIDYPAAGAFRAHHLRAAFARFNRRPRSRLRTELEQFREQSRSWLPDFALFCALKEAHGLIEWTRWPTALRIRAPAALTAARRALSDQIAFVDFEQWLFHRQFSALRRDCAAQGIGLIGDVPIFVAHDSADVWAHPKLWHLDRGGRPTMVAGVPPDYFSATGQRWGNPLYRWPVMRRSGYRWWVARLRQMLERFDVIRLDHFIGFQRYWQIRADCPTAVEGRWVRGPGFHFFERLREALGELPLIAEDLGMITPEVKALRDRVGLPGIRVLQFAFGADPSAPDFQPHNYPRHAVVYTGTHDNDTTVGWWNDRGSPSSTRTAAEVEAERTHTLEYLGSNGAEIHWDMIRAAFASVAQWSIVPFQDLLGLGSEARMNLPGSAAGNWPGGLVDGQLAPALAARLRRLTELYQR